MQRRRLAQRWLAPLLVPLVSLLTLLAACATPAARPTATAMPTGLPAFSDWRIAYADQNAHLHVVTADGKHDSTGPALPWYAPTGGTGQVSAVSPDGHILAYVSSNQYYVLDLTGKRHLFAPPVPIAYDLAWSPDSSLLAVSDREKVPVLYRPADGQLLHIPSTLDRAAGLGFLRGWIDNGHLAYDIYPSGPNGADATTLQLASLDIATGQVRVIASFPTALLGTADFLLSPDGQQALLYNHQFRSDPYTPELDLIDITSGQVKPLPNLAQKLSPYGGLDRPTWLPVTDDIAVATSGITGQMDPHPWLLDLVHDTYTPLPIANYPVAWLPDHGTLILLTGGPYGISVAHCGANGQCAVTPLTDHALHSVFLGLVRTA
jgi:hypothetical protein